MSMFTTSRRFTRRSDYTFSGNRTLRHRDRDGLDLLPADRSGASRERGREVR